MIFSEEQVKLLNEPLLKENVKSRDGTGGTQLSYLASFHVIEEANRIFGFDKWGTEILSLQQIDRTEYEKEPYKAGDPMKKMLSISYLCKLRLTVKGENGEVVKEDTGFGNGVAGNTAYGVGSVIELASKEAVTDALKRCLRYFGNKFGNTLYDNDRFALPDLGEFEASKTVTEEQLVSLRDLYMDREIDDEWVSAMMKGENYLGSLEDMRQDWFELAYKNTREYKLSDITSALYDENIKNVLDLMKESVNMNMLKSLFKEAWNKTTQQEDKDRQLEAQKIYEEMKEKLEPKKADK